MENLLAKLAIVLLGAEDASKIDWSVQSIAFRDGGDWWETISLKENKVLFQEGREWETIGSQEMTPMEFLTKNLEHHKRMLQERMDGLQKTSRNELYIRCINMHLKRLSEILTIKEWLFQNNYSNW